MPYRHDTTIAPQQIFINSKYASTYNNLTKKSDIYFNLEHTITIPSNVDAYLQINTLKLTNVFYNVTTTNNVFYYNASSVQILPGNYSISVLISALNDALLSDSIVLIYDSLTFKISVNSVSPVSLTLGENNCFNLLGISSDRIAAMLHVSDELINLSGVKVLYLTCKNIRIRSNGIQGSNLNNILESINLNVPIGSTLSYANSHNTKYKIDEYNISGINIAIYDENHDLVDFNNTDWYLSLSVIFSYKNQYIMPAQDLIRENNIEM
jgi:hypothetical protein